MASNKRVSLHFGIGTYDSAAFPTITSLDAPRHDARAMFNVAVQLGYMPLDLSPRQPWDGNDPAPPNVLTDKAAKYAPVVGLIRDAAAQLEDGDSCFITFSAHGVRLDNVEEGTTEDGKFDEATCLHDYTLRDDVLYGLLSGFVKGVTVLVVLDCCHSGANSPQIDILQNLRDRLVGFFRRWFLQEKEEPSPFGIAKVGTKPVASPPDLAVTLEKQFHDFNRGTIEANVAVFQACGPEEKTFDGRDDDEDELSVYSRKFVDSVGDGNKTIAQLRDAIALAKPKVPDSTPRFQPTGHRPFFDLQLKP